MHKASQTSRSRKEILFKLRIFSKKHLKTKYDWTMKDAYTKITNDMMSSTKSHQTAKFRDLLFSLDYTEFFKRIYKLKEALIRLTLLFEFYAENCKIYPNYCILEPAVYLYKYLDKKQTLVNENRGVKIRERLMKYNYNSTIFDSSVMYDIMNEKSVVISKPIEEECMSYIHDENDKWKIYNKKFDDSLYMIEMLILSIKKSEVKDENRNNPHEEMNMFSEKEAINRIKQQDKKRKERISIILKEGESLFDEISNHNNSKNITLNSFCTNKDPVDERVNQMKKRNEMSNLTTIKKPKIKFLSPVEACSSVQFENTQLKNSIHLNTKFNTSKRANDLDKNFLPILGAFLPTEDFIKKAKIKSTLDQVQIAERYHHVTAEMKSRFSINSKFKTLRIKPDSTLPEGTYAKPGSEIYKNSPRIKSAMKDKTNNANSKSVYCPHKTLNGKMDKTKKTLESCIGALACRNFQSANLVMNAISFNKDKIKQSMRDAKIYSSESKNSTVTSSGKKSKAKYVYKSEGVTLSDLKVKAKQKVVNC